ncbi:DMT family transporter [Pseudothioglobus sp. nBUS_23]|uniref:DMT family transporter n=1 Tax=Pseudothioglobus sp. nBUS_23 TaxID=3395318 RepID=UPI003EBF0A66
MFLVRFALLSSLFYALNVSMIPLIYSFEVSVFLFLFIRFGTTFCSSLFVTKSLFSFKKIKQQRLGLWIFLLSLLFAVQSWLYVEAVKYMSVGLASVVLFTYPLLTYLIVSITKKRSLDLTTILMFLIAIAGIAAISQSDEGFYTMAIGIILALLSALSYSLILIITPKMGSLRNWEIVKFTTLIPALSFLILFLSETGFYWPQKEALLLCFISGTLFAIGMMFYHISVKKYGPVRTANIGYTEPLLVLIFGFIAYLDTITIIQGIGVIMVALASITIEKRQLIQKNSAGE